MRAVLLTLALLSARVNASDWADGSGVDIEVRPGVIYHQASGEDLKLDLYLPLDRKRPRPLVIWVHGGGWVSGAREVANLRLLPWLQMGWAAANVSYRLARQATAPAAVEDVRCAVRWLAERASELGLDRTRIVLTGGSAGGHLALAAGMQPVPNRFDRACAMNGPGRWRSGEQAPVQVAAIVNLMGITNLPALLEPGTAGRGYAIEWFGSLPDAQRDGLARELSPVNLVGPHTPPILSFHGDADDIVPFDQAQQLHQALAAQNRPAQLVPIPGAKHGFSRAQMVEVMARTRDFLTHHGVGVAP
ncbi:alpha/beta hydrolase [Inhella gelatinilytica]|uniref:Alpha/beta hydrolase n=1 Tax=Inhella gelatinilytica TaxID=2795030 RepID=A0A931NEK1_9BURK|nr:alpha/beta hydrolase [Inhella gelatinilytica]MBH9552606.1 alpha/beta hydrolase [Inhella gelatinilytica]